MVDDTFRPLPQKGLIGRVAGAVTDRALDVVDPDILVHPVDVNLLLAKIDVQRLLERIDLDAVLQQVDMNALLARVDMNALLARVDVNQLLDDVDLEAVVRRSGIPEVVAESTSKLAGSTLDVARRQVAGLDFWAKRAGATRSRAQPGGRAPATAPRRVVAGGSAGSGGSRGLRRGRRPARGHWALCGAGGADL